MKSTKHMVKCCEGLIGTRDINDWESDFLQSLVDRSKNPAWQISEKQHETLLRIHTKHFGGQ